MPGQNQSLHDKSILITAGPTREHLDPVRYLTSPSSGVMGIQLAKKLRNMGAKVTLICGPTSSPLPSRIKTHRVTSALEMAHHVRRYLNKSQVFISTAAVSDWRFNQTHSQKLKKGSKSELTVRMIPNPDILKEAGTLKKKQKRHFPLLIGFALETKETLKASQKKLKEKNLDLIIGNKPMSFSSKTIQPLWLERKGPVKNYPRMTKSQLANRIGLWIQKKQKITLKPSTNNS